PHELHVASLRIGSDPGTHTVLLDSPADTIEIRHRARNRSGFALGSVRAAEWLTGRSGFCTVDDMMNDLIHRGEA
ncbi:MAG: 4-hydroxy-tetrahydrodipicolinate reductase, partial [Spirochaetaceae bacterium]